MLLIEHHQNFQAYSLERKEKICHVKRIIRIGCNVETYAEFDFLGAYISNRGINCPHYYRGFQNFVKTGGSRHIRFDG